MNLVRAVIEPRPAPVIVEAPPRVVEKTVVVETVPPVVATAPQVVTTAPGTVIVTGAKEVGIPEYNYVFFEGEYLPYYEDWVFCHDEWLWAGPTPRPAAPPRWTPPPRHRDHRPHKVIVLPERHHAPAPVVHHEAPRREPARTVVVRPETKVARPETKAARPETKVARPETKTAPRGEAPKQAAPKKGR